VSRATTLTAKAFPLVGGGALYYMSAFRRLDSVPEAWLAAWPSERGVCGAVRYNAVGLIGSILSAGQPFPRPRRHARRRRHRMRVLIVRRCHKADSAVVL
jgi:hypothetical protein